MIRKTAQNIQITVCILVDSYRKSVQLRRISLILGKGFSITSMDGVFKQMKERRRAEEQLFDLVEGNKYLRCELNRYHVTREDLHNLYSKLGAAGAGQWVCGHYVAASAFAFGFTLAHVLARLHAVPSDENDALETTSQLVKFFETNNRKWLAVPPLSYAQRAEESQDDGECHQTITRAQFRHLLETKIRQWETMYEEGQEFEPAAKMAKRLLPPSMAYLETPRYPTPEELAEHIILALEETGADLFVLEELEAMPASDRRDTNLEGILIPAHFSTE